MNKRIVSLILTISMLISLCVFNITANAAIGIEHEAQVSKLNAFGILTGYPDANYNASATVSAKDFVEAAYKLAGISGDYTSAMADKFGFKAEDKTITVQNAIAVLLSALNYDYEADAQGGYPGGYSKIASANKLLNGTASASGDNLTNDMMAVMLYNALDMDTLEVKTSNGYVTYGHRNKSVMESLKIYEGKGLLTGTEYAYLDGYTRAGSDSIIIDGISYDLGQTYADELLGYNVEFYYNDDKELLWIDMGSNMTAVRVAEADITSLTASSISYNYDNNKKKTYNYDNNITFIYNGRTVFNPDMDSFMPVSGYIVVIDNDGNGRADVISSESYDYYLVSEKNNDKQIINDYEADKQVSLNSDDYSKLKIVRDSVQISFADISVNDVVAVMKSEDNGGLAKAVVSPYKSVSGTIKSTSSGQIKIDSAAYDVSTAYEGPALSNSKEGTFYLDINGNVVRFVQNKAAISKYAYLITAYVDENGEDCYIKFLTAGSTVEERKLRRKFTYNKESITPKEFINRVSSGGNIQRQLITYSLGSTGEVNKIETANKNNLYSGKDKVSDTFSQYFQGHGRYRKNNMSFNTKYLIDADTPIFVVPSSRKTDDYEVRYAASLTNGTSYYISVYDIDEFMTAGAIVLDEVASDPEQLKAKRSIIVDEINTGVNEDDDLIVILEGYQQGSRVTLKTKDESFLKDSEGRNYSLGDVDGCTQLSRGDIIQTSLDSNGNLLAFRTLYKAYEEKKPLVIASNDTPNEYEEGGNANEFADLFILHGKVTTRSSNILVVTSDTKRAHKITNGCNVYVVEGKSVDKVTTADIYKNDEVYLHTYQGNLQEVVIYR